MNTKEALKSSLDMSLYVLNTYLSDLSDADLMQRPSKDCNHLAWQLGHLIASEVNLLESVCPGKAASLPEGFAEKHAKETTGNDNAADFCSLQEYNDLFGQVRAATLKALEEIDDNALDAPSPDWIRETFPTVGHMFTLIGSHPMMHAGQFAVVRRALGKPVLI
ncbi:MAG: DinB family protein [Planctomycetales bacterium]|nr:DinB family protein [Planctomycetales bacterium]